MRLQSFHSHDDSLNNVEWTTRWRNARSCSACWWRVLGLATAKKRLTAVRFLYHATIAACKFVLR